MKKDFLIKNMLNDENYYFYYHTRIPNQLLEAYLKYQFTSRQSKIFWLVARMTLGFKSRKYAVLNKTDFQICGLYLQDVSRALKELEKANVLLKEDNKIGLNTKTQEWLLPKIKNIDEEVFEKIRKRIFHRRLKGLSPDKAPGKQITEQIMPRNKQFTNDEVSKSLTIISENFNSEKEKLISNKIFNNKFNKTFDYYNLKDKELEERKKELQKQAEYLMTKEKNNKIDDKT